MADFTLLYANLFVSDFNRAYEFYSKTLGLKTLQKEDTFGYASFATGSATLAIAKVEEDQIDMVGRHSGVGLAVKDIEAAHKEMVGKGVEFTMAPSKQPWGSVLALFKDSEGNILYLDQISDQ